MRRISAPVVLSWLSVLLLVLGSAACSASAAEALPTATIRVHADQPGAAIAPHLYGLFFEDINFAADGGLYAELVQNRSFEYFPCIGWNPRSEQYHPLTAEALARYQATYAGGEEYWEDGDEDHDGGSNADSSKQSVARRRHARRRRHAGVRADQDEGVCGRGHMMAEEVPG